jgi:sugar-specific transcriptional regulator TrmB
MLKERFVNGNLKDLMDIGLSEREAKLYQAMLQAPDRTALELQKLASVPRTKIYEILGRMVERKLCIERQVGPGKRYSPIDPRHLIEMRKEELTKQVSEMDRVKKDLSEIYDRPRPEPVSLEYLEVLRTRSQVGQRINYLVDSCTSQLLVFTKLPLIVQTDEEANQATMRSLRRIKEVRSVYEFGYGLQPDWRQSIAKWREAGEESRFIHKLPTKLLIFDCFRTLLLVRDPALPDLEASILISNREIALAFRMLFEHVWNEAISFEEFMQNHDKIVAEYLIRRT